MRVEFRRLRTGEPDHELIWLAVSIGAAIAGIAWLALQLPWPDCTFRRLTGFPCLTCGATRASLALLHGDVGAAWRLNPLVCVIAWTVACFDLYALIVLTSGARRFRICWPNRMVRRLALSALGLVGVMNWIYLLQQ